MGARQSVVIDASIVDSKYVRIINDKLIVPVIDDRNRKRLFEFDFKTKKIKLRHADDKRRSSEISWLSFSWHSDDFDSKDERMETF